MNVSKKVSAITWLSKKGITPRLIGMFILFLIMLNIFFEVLDDIFWDPKEGDVEALEYDRKVLAWFKSIRTPMVDQIMADITALGSLSVLTIFTIILVCFL